MGRCTSSGRSSSSTGPTIVATEVSDERLKSLEDRLAHLAESNDCELITFNSQASETSLEDFVRGSPTGGVPTTWWSACPSPK